MRSLVPSLAAVALSAALQTVVFPVNGPLPFARAQLAWIALVPWLIVLFASAENAKRPMLRAALWSYLCGVLWYAGHCYWIFQTMHLYGNLSKPVAAVVLLLFCMYLGLYHACFGVLAAWLWRNLRSSYTSVLLSGLLAAIWVAVELARARVTSFPWDLLGYSQVDNAALTLLVPWAGVYSLSFLLALANVGFAIAVYCCARRIETAIPLPMQVRQWRSALSICAVLMIVSVSCGLLYHASRPAAENTAFAVQPNLDPLGETTAHVEKPPLEDQLAALSVAATRSVVGPKPHLILWPEAPTPFEIHEPHLQSTATALAIQQSATVMLDTNAVDKDSTTPRRYRLYNTAALFTGDGLHARYEKIHLVPFGEFMPFADLFQFASGLTAQVGLFDRGTRRLPLSDGSHSYGVFICYESIFPEEVRQLAAHGAQVFVNLSDDGWYGDTSAPFQHSNMARMRAMENRRWLLRDTNNGITESIDPYGNVRVAAPRHQRLAATLPYAYTSQTTFYTRHGDVFAWLCVFVTGLGLLASFRHSASAADLPTR